MTNLDSISLYHDQENQISAPTGIIMGPDQHIWFTSLMNNKIGKIDTSSNKISLFNDPTNRLSMPANIYPDTSQHLWFTAVGSHHIGKINPFCQNPSSSIELYSHKLIKNPVAIKRSKNGSMWFSLRGSNAIGCISPNAISPEKSIKIYQHPKIYAPAAIFITDNDELFFTNNEKNNPEIGFLDSNSNTPNETILIQSIPNKNMRLRAWAQDKQNKIWLTSHNPDSLIYFEPSSFAKKPEFHIIKHANIKKPDGIYLASDGYLYFVNTGSNSIGKIATDSKNPASTLEIFTHPDIKGLCDIKPGPNHSMWFTDKIGNSIGKLLYLI